MSSVNKVILIGRLGRDPETRFSAGGDAIANLTLATSDKWRDKQSGEMRETTEWHRVTLFRRNAEVARDFLKKGAQVYVEGKLQTRRYEDKEGVERFITEVVGDTVQMLGPKPAPLADGSDYRAAKDGRKPVPSITDIPDEDIPF